MTVEKDTCFPNSERNFFEGIFKMLRGDIMNSACVLVSDLEDQHLGFFGCLNKAGKEKKTIKLHHRNTTRQQ